jgi:glycerophosphoryl diester phosphodiesterase
VDGIITDYPDRLRAVMQARGMALPPQVAVRAARAPAPVEEILPAPPPRFGVAPQLP